jgi:hypothetical protein
MKFTYIYDQDFYSLLAQYKHHPNESNLNLIRVKLFTILYNPSRDCQDEDINEGVLNFLKNFSQTTVDNFLHSLEQANIDFIPSNKQTISSFFLSYCKRACHNKTIDIKRKKYRLSTVSLDVQLSSNSHTSFIDMIPDHRNTPEELLISQETSEIISEIIEDETLHQIHPKKYPNCHLVAILIRRLQNQSFTVIAQEFGIKIGTLTGFWHRKCKPILRARFSV